MKNISNNHGKFRIMKYFKKEYHDFGSYPSIEIAKHIRDKLEKNGWEIPFQNTTIFELDNKFHIIQNVSKDITSKATLLYVGEASSLAEAELIAKKIEIYSMYTIRKKCSIIGYYTYHKLK